MIANKEDIDSAAEAFFILEKRNKSELEKAGIKLPGVPLSMEDEWYAVVLHIIESQDAIRMIEARTQKAAADE